MKVVVAEKPELARNIAHAVCGAPEAARLPWQGNGWEVVACAGHLVELAEPAAIEPERWGAPWREEELPIMPDPWPLAVAEGKGALAENVRRALSRADVVYHAGDPDDEGQLIVDELLGFYGYKGPVLRVLVNDSIDANIRRAFERADDNGAHEGAGRAARARSLADKAVGVNESRLATLRAMRGGGTLSVGRVQTPTLALIVARDREIACHVAETYHTVTAMVSLAGNPPLRFTLRPDEALLDEGGRIGDKVLAERLRASCEKARGVAATKVEAKREPAPLPYNLTDLTAGMSRRHKMGAARVMAATQALREEHRAITYNRSDCPYLPTEAFVAAPATLARAMANIGERWDLDFSRMPRCFDDSKVDAHTGIVPQDVAVDVHALSPDQKLVYRAIVERYAMQFAGDEVFEVSVTELEVAGGTLTHKARRQVSPGWRAVADDGRAGKGFDEGWVDEGEREAAATSAEAEEKKTKPRAPYTEGTLVKDMASAAKYVADPRLKEALRRKDEGKPGEHGGIGTTATRADVIEKLKARGFVKDDGRGHLVSTGLGRKFLAACPADLASVDTTAQWWLTQERVAAGELPVTAVAELAMGAFRAHKEGGAWASASLSRADSMETVGKCPICGADVIDPGPSSKTYRCSKRTWDKERQVAGGCPFELWKTQFRKRLTAKQVSDLLAKGKTGLVKGLTGKAGKKFDAYLLLDRATGKVSLEFPRRGGKGRVG